MSEHDQVRIEPPDFDVSRTLTEIADVIESRKGADPDKSYVAKLFSKAPDGILKKIGEESQRHHLRDGRPVVSHTRDAFALRAAA